MGLSERVPQAEGNQAEQVEQLEEAKRIRRFQIMFNMVLQVIAQDPNLSIEEASQMCADCKRAAMAMFPDEELAYDLIYKPRLQRMMNERFRLQ
jgi:hypothetical protein